MLKSDKFIVVNDNELGNYERMVFYDYVRDNSLGLLKNFDESLDGDNKLWYEVLDKLDECGRSKGKYFDYDFFENKYGWGKDDVKLLFEIIESILKCKFEWENKNE